MKSFKSYIEEQSNALHVFDIDDTMFHTTARVRVRNKDGKIIRYLSNAQFNNYKLKPGEKYDFREFRSASKFDRESRPINKMLQTVRKVHGLSKTKKNSKVIINTARADFDDKEQFLNKFRKHDIDIDDIHVHRAGNIPGDDLPAHKKVKIIKQYIDKHGYKKVVMYDDSKSNLKALLHMKKAYPHVRFVAYHAQPDGSIKHFKGE